MRVNVQAAKANLTELIEAALSGEEVVIENGEQPEVKLVPVEQKFRFDLLKEKLGAGPDFLEPMSDDDIAQWEGAA